MTAWRRNLRTPPPPRRVTSLPLNRTRPPVVRVRRSAARARVVLPDPDSPTIPSTSPSPTSRSTPSTARTPLALSEKLCQTAVSGEHDVQAFELQEWRAAIRGGNRRRARWGWSRSCRGGGGVSRLRAVEGGIGIPHVASDRLAQAGCDKARLLDPADVLHVAATGGEPAAASSPRREGTCPGMLASGRPRWARVGIASSKASV